MKDTDSRTEKAANGLHIPTWIWVTALLMAEYVGISLVFDANAVMKHAGNASGVISLGMFMPLAMTVATATVGLRFHELRAEFAELVSEDFSWRDSLPQILVHVLALGAFAWIPAKLAATEVADLAYPYAWLTAWAALGLVSTAALVQVVLPFRLWHVAFRSIFGSLAIGVGVGTAAWASGVLSSKLWDPLGHVTLATVATILGWVEPEIIADPVHRAVGTHDFYVLIAPQCSGYEGIGLMSAYMVGYATLARKRLRFPQALLLIPLGVGAVFLANALRITMLILVGSHISAGFSFEAFHSKLGWIFFCAIALGLSYIAERSSWFSSTPGSTDPVELVDEEPSPTKAYLLPMMAVVAFTMVTGLFATTFNPYYPAVVLTALLFVWLYRSQYGSLLPSFSWEATGIGVLVFAIWVALEPPLEASPKPAFVSQWVAGTGILWLVFRVIGSVIVIPIVEELAFRGYLLRRLISREFTEVSYRHFTWVSFFISSVAFGALHSRWAAGIFAGLLFAMAQMRRGKIGDAIWAHAVANACIAATVLYGNYWGLWL
jgi:exosortase E/protease (VPEID-CTERM system)